MNHGKLKTALALAVGLLGGCSLIPDYQRPPAPVADSWSGAPADAQAVLPWMSFFKDDQLKGLIGEALANNRDLRVSLLNIEKAQAQYRIRRADLLPSIDANLSGTHQRTPADLSLDGRTQTSHRYDAGVGFASYEVDFFGRVRSLNEQALEAYLQTVEAQRSAQVALVSEVANAYYQLQADLQSLALSDQTLESQHQSYLTIRSSYQEDVATELDLSQAESTVRSAQASQARYHRLVEQDRNALVLLVGKPLAPVQLALAASDTPELDTALPAGLPSQVLTRRPDILAAEHALKAANANVGAARAAFFPNISMTASAGSASGQLGDLFAGGQGAWSFVPSINVPIFNWGRNQANLDVAKVQTLIEVANYQKAIQQAFREVADGLVARGKLDSQVTAQELLVKANARSHDLARLRYETGVDTYLNSLDAQRNLYASQQELVDTRLARSQNLIALYKALGGGSE
ncbi:MULTISPECIES: efflux transporter outer membrane subunit [Pseudomonas]|uniref:efflux transporter outer membrane subunit n=1 Tax=Pseudomonas TaxID=286 RepID=UPI000C86A54C|nr:MULTISPECIES: efflux transporter outer membrane subunit [Pseudomonas]MDQ2483296.1 efflux transporter outer membrane subunit [Pseudomonas putida]PMU27648.1 multidrug transporter [Pseudomonas sp. GP01-A9]PMU32810.1 multidrug transporter [Pseudomonas sp. GP01-A13]PMU45068.1 multidrug transporter [Pseudomonas sp. GP01-A8]PMU56877.1 multidrug transporter [Pseudomonas sp. GP01-A14]